MASVRGRRACGGWPDGLRYARGAWTTTFLQGEDGVRERTLRDFVLHVDAELVPSTTFGDMGIPMSSRIRLVSVPIGASISLRPTPWSRLGGGTCPPPLGRSTGGEKSWLNERRSARAGVYIEQTYSVHRDRDPAGRRRGGSQCEGAERTSVASCGGLRKMNARSCSDTRALGPGDFV